MISTHLPGGESPPSPNLKGGREVPPIDYLVFWNIGAFFKIS